MNSEHLGQNGCHLMLLLPDHRSHIVSIDIKTVKLFLFEIIGQLENERKNMRWLQQIFVLIPQKNEK